MKIQTKQGFTLIELLVVIAIIGILSSVVLASLNTARSRGNDTAVKQNLASIRPQAEIIYDTDGDYDAVCGANSVTQSTNVANMIAAASTSSNLSPSAFVICGKPASGAASAWAAQVGLKTQNLFGASSGQDYWCVDSTGAAKLRDTTIAATDVAC